MSQDSITSFERVLRARHVIVLAFGAMIGWSWVLLTGNWITNAGSLGTLIAFALGGSAIVFIGLTYAELASALPQAGGEHVYTHRALGPGWSFACTWSLLFAYVNVCMFEAVALPTALEYLVPQIKVGTLWTILGSPVDAGFVIVGGLGATIVTWINVRGIEQAARLQTVVMLLILMAGVILAVGALLFGSFDNAAPLIATPTTGILTVLIMVPAMLIGFDVIPQSAEEINLPRHRIGSLLIVSVVCAVAWYGLISLAVATSIPADQLRNANMASGDAATALWGEWWGGSWAGQLVVLGGVGGILTSWNAFVIGGSRVLYALARSGQIPSIFGRLHHRYHTPYVGILAIGLLSVIAPLFGRTLLVWLINAGSFAVVIAYLFVPVSMLVLRQREPDLPRPYALAAPRAIGYTAIVLALALLAVYLPWSPSALLWPHEWAMILVWAFLGGLVYLTHRGGEHG